MACNRVRNWPAALLAGALLIGLCSFATDGYARGGGGHFGGGIGGGHFGGDRFEARPELRAPEREFRPEEMRRPEEMHVPAEGHRPADDALRHEAPGEHELRDNAGRDVGERRDLATHDFRNPVNVNTGRWDHNQFWNTAFGARTFDCNGCRWGWARGVFWPFAYGDIFSWAWWPYAGVPAFWNYGLDTILTGLFWPYGVYQWPEGYGAYAWAGDGSSYEYSREARQEVLSAGPANEAVQSAPESTTEIAQTCSGLAPGVDSLPIDRIAQTLKPEAGQRAALDQLEAASAKAEAILKGACPSEPPLTPVGRLDALGKRLNAMVAAIGTVKAPLANFSSVLSEEQRHELDAMGGSGSRSAMEMGDVGDCIDQGQQFANVPAQQIAEAVQPDARQRTALDQLKTVAAQAAERLRSQCPTSVPATPEARLAAMDKRLTETIVAVNEVRPALVGFYESLNDEQKARFNTLPPEQTSARP